ncbi:DUF2500 domain-containing protein [Paenibacillus agri]|uniref:DUF2500 domain-containing protein n=1 Tax=Paenibacillus agri TaxID=2744309 RepID=UPI001FE29F2D|nr:DUF2500 domain-containing protein [Paenibacillus agri]
MNGWDDFGAFRKQSFFEGFLGDVPTFFKIFFVFFLLVFIFIIYKMVQNWLAYKASPLTTGYYQAVAKRSEVWGGSGDHSASTSYYVTFEDEGGNRVELQVPNSAYGYIIEGDTGELTYQGIRFKHFQRQGSRSGSRL